MSNGEAPPQNLSTLEEWVVVQVEVLQRSLARTRLALLGVAALFLAWIVIPPALHAARERGLLPGGPGPGEVRAKRFVLTDAENKERGTWTVDEGGASRLLIRDAQGIARVRLSVLDGGSPGLALTDEAGRGRVVLGLLPDRSSSLVLADPTGATRVVLGLAPDNGATLVFADAAGETRAGMGVDTGGQPTFMMVTRETAEADSTGVP